MPHSPPALAVALAATRRTVLRRLSLRRNAILLCQLRCLTIVFLPSFPPPLRLFLRLLFCCNAARVGLGLHAKQVAAMAVLCDSGEYGKIALARRVIHDPEVLMHLLHAGMDARHVAAFAGEYFLLSPLNELDGANWSFQSIFDGWTRRPRARHPRSLLLSCLQRHPLPSLLLLRTLLSRFRPSLLLVLAQQAFLRLLGRLLARPTLLSSRCLRLRLLALFVQQRCLFPSLAPLSRLLALLVLLPLGRRLLGFAPCCQAAALLSSVPAVPAASLRVVNADVVPFPVLFLLHLHPLHVLRRRLLPCRCHALVHRRRPSPPNCLLLVLASIQLTITITWRSCRVLCALREHTEDGRPISRHTSWAPSARGAA